MIKQNQKTTITNNTRKKFWEYISFDNPLFPQVRKYCFILVAISCIVYANTINNGYVLDDIAVIKENTYIAKGIKAIPTILSTPYLKGYKRATDTTAANDLYRPLSLVMFAAEHQFFNDAAAGSHFMNMLIFAACVIALFIFLDRLFERKRTGVAFITSLLFAVHPIHTEVVANLKSRDELLCFFFALCSMVIFIKYTRSGRVYHLLSAAFYYFLSLLAKETSITFLFIIPLVYFFYINENKKRSMHITIASALIAIIYLAIRFSILKAYNATSTDIDFIDNELTLAPSFAIRAATAILILGYYIKLLFLPYPLICDYSFDSIPYTNFTNIGVLLSLAIYSALIFYGIRRLIKNKKDPLAFGILFFLVTLAIFSNLIFLVGATMAERFLFFSSAGFCLVIALLLSKWIEKTMPEQKNLIPTKLWFVLAPVCVVFALLTIYRNVDWKDNYTLFITDVKKSPGDARLWYYLGYEINSVLLDEEPDATNKKQLLQEGITAFQQALSIYPQYANVHKDLGNLFLKALQYDSAEAHFKQALALSKKNPANAISDLGYVYFLEKKYPEAILLCKRALSINPGSVEIMNNLAICYLQIQQYDSAIIVSRKALQIDPENKLSKENILSAMNGRGKIDSTGKEPTTLY